MSNAEFEAVVPVEPVGQQVPPVSDPSIDAMQEGVDATMAPDMQGDQLAKYTIYVPWKDNTGREIPHVLDQVRQTLTNSGFPGRTVIRNVQGDWQGDSENYDVEEMTLVQIDAPDDPQTLNAIKIVADGIKQLAGQEAVYLTVQPVTTYLI